MLWSFCLESVLIFIHRGNYLLVQILNPFPGLPWAEVKHASLGLSSLLYIPVVDRTLTSYRCPSSNSQDL